MQDKKTKEITRCVANKEPGNSPYKPGRKPDQCGLFQQGNCTPYPRTSGMALFLQPSVQKGDSAGTNGAK
ncbi:hypothetical protein [Pasteuria penetrans]|uniref:hypothetical protein n=1 Tax=Pasteuria penetrans TaxID=86005 RepID=UPI001CAA5E42|nr:hypothetical protein [Pasteuria penetrans]